MYYLRVTSLFKEDILLIVTLTAIVLIVISAFSHAFWNLLGKRHNSTASFFLVATGAAAIILSPILVYYRHSLTYVPLVVWGLLFLAGIWQTVYYVGLAGAYRKGDMSLAYPLARATPVVLVTVISNVLGWGERLGALGLWGITLVSVGCFILPLVDFRNFRVQNYLTPCCFLAMVAALGTTGYTLVDSAALQQVRTLPQLTLSNSEITLVYVTLETFSTMFILAGYVLLRPSERPHFKTVWHTTLRDAAVTGLIITATYGLVLASMAYVTNVSYVAAFRQLSIPLGTLLGLVVQGEPRYPPKVIGTGLVFTGLVCLGLA